MLQDAIHWVLHIDKSLVELVNTYGTATYYILFAIVFCETGLVVTPFLPGDSLLFAAGALAGGGHLNFSILAVSLWVAAVIGDAVNYHIGKYLGPKVFSKDKGLLFNKDHLVKTQRFYDKYGPKTIVIARFLPIVRTFAPFVAGIGKMAYGRFVAYNLFGATLWIAIFLGAGYKFGQTEIVQKNFKLVILGIIVISCLPPIYEVIKARRESKAEREKAKTA
jgi:membrane-associated protein